MREGGGGGGGGGVRERRREEQEKRRWKKGEGKGGGKKLNQKGYVLGILPSIPPSRSHVSISNCISTPPSHPFLHLSLHPPVWTLLSLVHSPLMSICEVCSSCSRALSLLASSAGHWVSGPSQLLLLAPFYQ